MASLFPPPVFQGFVQGTNTPLSGGKLYVYVAGTTTPSTSYTDRDEGTANANPVELDSNGIANVWLPVGQFKLVLKDSDDVTQWTVDEVAGGSDQSFWVASGSDIYYLAGNVGIGTSTITETLTVDGTLSVTDNVTMDSDLSVGDDLTITDNLTVGGKANVDESVTVGDGNAGSVTPSSEANEIVAESSGAGGMSVLTPDGSKGSLFFGSPSSNVGAYVRNIYDSTMQIGTNASNGNMKLYTGSSVEAVDIDSTGNILMAQNLRVQKDFTVIGAVSKAFFVNGTTDKVGVFTILPEARFQIENTLQSSDGTLTDAALAISWGGAGTSNDLIISSDSATDTPFLQSRDGDTSYQSIAINPYGGNVGIGVANPTVALDVLGDTLLTGDATFTGDLTVDTDTFFVDASTDRVGIGTSSPSVLNHLFKEVDTDFSTISSNISSANALLSVDNGEDDTATSNRYALMSFVSHDGTSSSGYTMIGNVSEGDREGNFIVATRGGVGDTNVTEKLRVAYDGNVGIGTATPSSLIHIADGEGTVPTLSTGVTGIFQNNDDASDDCIIEILAGASGISGIHFGDASDADVGSINFSHVSNSMILGVSGSTQVTVSSSDTLINTLKLPSSSNGRTGTATLSSGTVVVANTSVTANSKILLTYSALSGTVGTYLVAVKNAGVGFTINSGGGSDNSSVDWMIVEATT